jgi:polyisoprenoid-binding protein YceI
MKKLILMPLMAWAMILMSFTANVPTTWELDKYHAKLGFSISHLMVSDVEGSFKKFDAKVTSSKEDFSDAIAELTAEVASINTEDEKRDEHLRNADFFDVAKYPTMTFRSTSFKKSGTNKYTVKGNLTLHGVTKPVTLTAIAKTGTNPMSKKTITGFKVTGKINRTDFGIAPSTPAAMLGNEVEIIANAEFAKS